MKISRKIGILLLVILVVMQFVQPTRNISNEVGENDISKVLDMSDTLHNMLVHKCYDCHSNNTQYPWYAFVQPIGWWLAAHVNDGKKHLNFSEFKTYSAKRAAHKLDELKEVTEDRSMPLKLYTYLHKNTTLTPEDEALIIEWLKTVQSKE
jgi:hypothetical protein